MGTGNRLSLMLAVVAGASAPAGLKGVRAAETARDGWGSGRLTSALHPGRGLTVAQEDQAPPEQAPEEGLAYPATPPPDLIPEYPPPSPGYGYLWIRGYWDWTGYDWTWNSGFWTPRQAGITFYAPRFIFVNGEPVYYRGYWADPYGRREYGYGWRGAPPAAWRARPSMAPVAWRTQHSEGWRRAPGAPPAWRAPMQRETVRGSRPGEEPRRFERGPAMGHAEPGRPGPAPVAGGWHGGPASRPGEGMGANRTPVAASPHPDPAPAPHLPAPPPHMAAPPPHMAAPSPPAAWPPAWTCQPPSPRSFYAECAFSASIP